jgi:hypothetical protein
MCQKNGPVDHLTVRGSLTLRRRRRSSDGKGRHDEGSRVTGPIRPPRVAASLTVLHSRPSLASPLRVSPTHEGGPDEKERSRLLRRAAPVGGGIQRRMRGHGHSQELQGKLPGHRQHVRQGVHRRCLQNQVFDRPRQLHGLLQHRHRQSSRRRVIETQWGCRLGRRLHAQRGGTQAFREGQRFREAPGCRRAIGGQFLRSRAVSLALPWSGCL